LAKAGLKLDDIGVIELNEAFAVQALAVMRVKPNRSGRVNLNGRCDRRSAIRWAAPAPS
jgi:acetyl-CoA acetyltransferase